MTARIVRQAPIRFFEPAGPYGFLSNFSPHPVSVAGLAGATAEHCFQALKFGRDPARRRRILAAASPDEAKRIAWEKEAVYPPGWFDHLRLEAMAAVLAAKFGQHPELAAALMATGQRRLIEASRRDFFWGEGEDGSGANMLGRLLMALRARLQIDLLLRGAAGCDGQRA